MFTEFEQRIVKLCLKTSVERQTISLPVTPTTIDWVGDRIVDRNNGEQYYPEYDAYPPGRGMPRGVGYSFPGWLDGAVSSPDGRYTLLYTRRGTKGLLLRDGKDLIREVNRSYYCAESYEYPAAFFKVPDGRTFLVHCPNGYNRLDFEDVETGVIITNHSDRAPKVFFHSRLEISPAGRYLVSKGWFWHPWDIVVIYDISACLMDPLLLDEIDQQVADGNVEVSTASSIDESRLLVGASAETPFDDERPVLLPPGHIGIWDMQLREIIHKVQPEVETGNLIAVDDAFALDLYRYPKLINLRTGTIEWGAEDIFSGEQRSAIVGSRIIPPMAWHRALRKLAIGGEKKIDVLTVG